MKRLIDFSSRFRILKGGKISLVVSALLGTTTLTFAAPSGGVVTSGSANISQVGNTTNITQNTGKVSINWNKFNIASNETVNFKQPNVNSIALNRVIGNEKSIINGALNANGQVWILNSNGVLFGKNAKINTAGLLATTKNLSDEDFNAGNYNFKGSSTQSVINLGEIDISDSGYATLLANSVSNEGTIKAIKGSVRLIGANEVSINLNGNSIVDLTVNKGVLDSLVENKGAVYADGGEIYLTTNAVDELLKGVVNNTGIIEANSLDGITGHVELFAHGGEAKIGGTITALDGFVETSGKEFTFNDATIKAGEWLIDPVNVTIDEGLATAIEGQLENGRATITTDGGNTPDTSSTESGSDGNIFVNSAISWDSGNDLTFRAHDSIYINAPITATQDRLVLIFGFASADGGTSDYYINAKVNLSAGNNFSTQKGTHGDETLWTVITHDNLASAITTGGLDYNYVLGSDLDLSGINWTPIGDYSTRFKGNFDGLGHVVDKLTINNSSGEYQGLFGYAEYATIRNIGLTNANVTGGSNVGSLVGMNVASTIHNSYSVDGDVTGIEKVGGLVGYNYSATIQNVYSSGGTVSGDSDVGGLVGSNFASSNIKNSYTSNTVSTVSATTSDNVGGLVGDNSHATITNSWYDNEANTDTSMNDSSTYGKTKAEILTALSSLDAWTAGGGANVEGYSTATPLALPELITFYTSNGEVLFAGGFGRSDDPYEITNWTQLQNINNSNILNQNYYFSLQNNLDSSISGYTNLASNTANSEAGWTPIGNFSTKFTGNFDGLGHSVSNLSINQVSSDYMGLFGSSYNAKIQNLDLLNIDIIGKNNVGGLIGYANNTEIKNATVTGSIKGTNQYTGGLLGEAEGTNIYDTTVSGSIVGHDQYTGGLIGRAINTHIENTTTAGTVSGYQQVGGLVGEMMDSAATVLNSSSSARVSGSDNVGGLIGKLLYSKIENSYATGKVESVNSSIGNIGGLVGYATSSLIDQSYASGNVNGTDSTGGLVGKTFRTDIKNSYAKGDVSGSFHVGGIVGDLSSDSTISNSYALTQNLSGSMMIGGLVGMNGDNTFSNVTNSYWDTDISEEESSKGGLGKTSAELKELVTFSDTGWDIQEDDTLDSSTPFLAWEKDGNSYTKVWVIGTKVASKGGGTTTPTNPTNPTTQKEIDKVVTTIVNKEAVKVPNIPKVTKTPNNAGKNVNVAFNIGENKQIVSKPIEGQATKRVTLSEAKQMQQDATGQTVGEVRVPLSRSSIIQLVDGGVSLPNGVEQEFYVADNK
ncbi:filamentous hemagglutinin family protein [Malaciobacter marinus]|jgi:filamentous hemagglutinin family protein|uniref:Filamentous hemagglutinin family protein n=1 Tax=Malaciobacter marinus TaxID=505249 RepID=A0AB36ZT62_9BACT|nr:GLUG motif-containing protein [Malaciobacter marinus]PPK57796.1 filamentous hemagglutinin family protein [Malaciobacter marinus]